MESTRFNIWHQLIYKWNKQQAKTQQTVLQKKKKVRKITKQNQHW